MTCATCISLLNEALNLAVRSDQFAEQDRRKAQLDASIDGKAWEESGRFSDHVERHNEYYPQSRIAPKSMTMHLWVQDQYDKDLMNWQMQARKHLIEGCPQ